MKRNNSISEKMRAIRPFVDFNYSLKDIKAGKLSSYAENKITKYFEAISAATAQPVYAYKPRSKENRQKAIDYSNQENLKGMKVVFIPVPRQGMKPELKFNKSGLTVKTGYVETTHVAFNKSNLVRDREKEVKRALSKFPDKFNKFTIQCGQFEYLVATNRNTVDGEVARLMERYSEPDKNNYHGKWLNGLFGYQFNNQSSSGAYFAAKSRARKDKQRTRRNAKRTGKTIV